MAFTELTVQPIVRTGLNPTLSAVTAGGESFINDGKTFLYVDNAGGSPTSVTIDTILTETGLTIPDLIVSVPAGEFRLIGPFPSSVYSQEDTDNGLSAAVKFTCSPTTSVTAGAIKLTQVP